jgi:hypothetical protein
LPNSCPFHDDRVCFSDDWFPINTQIAKRYKRLKYFSEVKVKNLISLCNIVVVLSKLVNPEPNVVCFLWVLRFLHTGRKICLKKVSTFMTIWLAQHAFIVDLQTRDSKQYILPELVICTFSFLFSCLNQSAGKNHCIQHKYNVDINWYLVFF